MPGWDNREQCLRGGCMDWRYASPRSEFEMICCARCGFDEREAERRKGIPLELRVDGLRRKIIRRPKNE